MTNTLIGIVIIGINAILAWLSTQFNDENSYLGLFFLLLAIGMIPANIGVLITILETSSVDANIVNAVGALYKMSIFMVVLFVAIILLKFLYNTLVQPVEKLDQNTYNNYAPRVIK